jgi:hypothetical protein
MGRQTSSSASRGSVFLANQARTIYRALGIQKTEIERGQPWQNSIESHFNVMRRMADYHFARATTWAALRSIHERFFRDYNHQPPTAHNDRSKGRRSPAAVLGWVQGAWCERAAIDRLFQLRAWRVLNEHGSLRFRHWRLYGERGLAGKPAAVWLCGETLTIEHATEALAQHRVTLADNEQRIRDVSDPQLFVTGHASPQPFLSPLDEVEWRPAQRLAPYRPRRRRDGEGTQEPLFAVADEAALG